ncbi:unnamed protein product [Tilletia controversa]|nr:unnamed protein product [Tilletia controversa]
MDVLGASEPFTATWFDALTTLEFKRAVLPSWSYSSAYGIVWLDEASLSPTDSGADTVIHGRDEFPPERQLRELHEHSLAHRAAGRDISALSFFLGGKTKFWTLEKLDAVRSYACLKDRIERGRHFLDLLHLHHAIGAIEEDEVQYIHHQPLFICRGGDFSLSYGDLGVLAGEKWLSNQVIDFHIFSVLQFSAPGTVILDAGFSTVLRGAYDNQITESTATAKRPYGHVLTSAASQGIRLVGFAHYTPSHWESVLLDLPASTISYGCSLGYSMPTDLQSALEWWLGGASLQQGSLLDAPYQGATSGSCGVVAVNTLLRGVQLAQGLEPCDPWTQETAAAHRSMWFLGALKVLSNLPMHTPAAASDIVMAKTPPVPAWRPSEPTAAPSSPNSSLPDLRSPTYAARRARPDRSITPHSAKNVPNQSPTSTISSTTEFSITSSPIASAPKEQHKSKHPSPSRASRTPIKKLLLASFEDMEEAVQACVKFAKADGFTLHRDSSRKKSVGGQQVTFTKRLRCASWDGARLRLDSEVDPANQRSSSKPVEKADCKTSRCKARMNIRLSAAKNNWNVSSIDWNHNHAPHFDPSTTDPDANKTTEAERTIVAALASGSARLDRAAIRDVLRSVVPGSKMTTIQITNVVTAERKKRRETLNTYGGDVASLLSWLAKEKVKDARFTYSFHCHPQTGALQRLFMSSPVMIDALGQFGDVLIADVAQGRNVYNMPLNVFSVIDGCGKTRNIGYAVQDREDHASHAWVLHALLRTTGKKPSVIISDQDAAFISAVREVLPTSHHVLCLYHLWQNIVKQLKGKLRGQWVSFAQSFWRVYKAPSPNAFEARWRDLLESYPRARTYLETYQYKNRRSWAAAWVRTRFTADTRTTGRVESENGLSKLLSDRKSTLSDLFSRLLLRAEDQMAKSIKVSAYLHKKPTPTEVLFQVVIDTCRDQCHVWAVRRIVGEMEEGVMYSAVAVSMPPVPVSVPNIPASAPNQTSAFASGPGHPQQHDEHMDDEEENVGDEVNGKEEEEEEVGYNPTQDLEDDLLAEAHENGEEGTIEEENTTTGIPVDIDGVELDGGYLVELVTSSGHEVVRAYRVTHFKATNPRIVLVTKDGLQFCTCSESTASGVPCRHSWATIARGEWFHMADVNARWLRKGHSPMDPVQVNTSQFEIPEPVLAHNGSCRTGLDTAADALSPAPDATLPHAQVYHQALTIMRPVMNSITTPAGLRQFEQMVDEFM